MFALLMYVYLASVDMNFFHYVNPIFVLAGALLPDCDHRHAPAGKFIPLWLICNHRGFTHTLWGMVTFALIPMIWHVSWGVSLALGYATHLMLDACTPMGIHFLGKKKPTVRRASRR